MLCTVCQQPECKDSSYGERPSPGGIPSRLADGEHESRGYGEWVVHPLEAIFLLHRGFAVVDGVQQRVSLIHNEAFVTQLRVEGTFAREELFDDVFVDTAFTGDERGDPRMRSNGRLDTHSVAPTKVNPAVEVPVIRPIGNPERFGQEAELRAAMQEISEEGAEANVQRTNP